MSVAVTLLLLATNCVQEQNRKAQAQSVEIVAGTTEAFAQNPLTAKERKRDRIIHDSTRDALIAPKPCSTHEAYRNQDEAHVPYKPALDGIAVSLHELVCRWAVDQDLDVDSTRLPQYVEAMSDTLRLSDDAFAYAVKLKFVDGGTYDPNTLYLVAQVADSLYYRDIEQERPHSSNPSRLSVRALRTLDVPRASSEYIWFETKEERIFRTDTTTWVSEEWRGHVLRYDAQRGVRYLDFAPIRLSEDKNGDFYGMEQWDIAVPEPGIMEVSVRERRGKPVDMGPLEWLGRRVIDTTATNEREMQRTCCE